MTEFQEKSLVRASERLSEAVFRLTVHAPQIARSAQPGQFVMIRSGAGLDPLLRRPFSIHQVTGDGELQLLFKVIGKGTKYLSELREGDTTDLIGPLGRGFNLQGEEPACLIGGGMGIAPLYFLAKRISQLVRRQGKDVVLLGARNGTELSPLVRGFTDLGYQVDMATDDGSLGHHGFVTELLQGVLSRVGRVYVCGPETMMGRVAGQCREAGVGCQASLETHMACGLGACLGCTVPGVDGNYRHVCKHGPVFDAQEVLWKL